MATGVPDDAFNPFNPFNQIISGGSRARLAEFGNRLFDNESDAFLATLGVRGDKLFDGNWGYDFGYRYSQIKNTSTGTLTSTSRFNRILNAADPIFDPASDQFIGTTIPFNPFGDYRVPIDCECGDSQLRDRSSKRYRHVQALDTRSEHLHDPAVQATGRPESVSLLVVSSVVKISSKTLMTLNVRGRHHRCSRTAITHAGRKDFAFYAETDIPVFSAGDGSSSIPLRWSSQRRCVLKNSATTIPTSWCRSLDCAGSRSTINSLFVRPGAKVSVSHRSSNCSLHQLPDCYRRPSWAHSEPETTIITSSNPNLAPERFPRFQCRYRLYA